MQERGQVEREMKKEAKSRQPLLPGVRKKEAGSPHKWRKMEEVFRKSQNFRIFRSPGRNMTVVMGPVGCALKAWGMIRSSEWKR